MGEVEGPGGNARRRALGLDLRPLRASRDYRLLFLAGFVGTIGGEGTYVVVLYQMKLLTGSLLAVGLLGVVEIVPLVVCGLLGGSLADAVDKRRIIIWCEVAMLGGTLALLVNSASGHPSPVVLYVVAAIFAAANSLQRPSLDSLTPRLVAHDLLASAASLSVFRWTFGSIVGPLVGGTVAVVIGPTLWYLVDAVTFLVSLGCFLTIASAPPLGDAEPASLRQLVEGFKFAVARRDLLGTYLVDFAAMIFAFPIALLPFLASRYHQPYALGALYAGLPIGALLASLTSSWTSSVRHHGRAILVAAAAWGVAIAALGFATSLVIALGALIAAGAADALSGVFRSTMWNASIPDDVRGRMAGIELLSYSTGPTLGQLRSTLVALKTSTQASIVSGGLLCVASCGLLAFCLPTMWRFDASSDANVAMVKAQRAAARASGESGPTPAGH